MDQQLKRLATFVRYCRKHGVKSYTSPDFSFELAPALPKKSPQADELPDLSKLPNVPSDVTKSPFLFWSTPDDFSEMNNA